MNALRGWVDGLQLPRGNLTAFDEAGRAVDFELIADRPVYIKYNSSDNGHAYVKSNVNDGFAGVIVQPKFAISIGEETFFQFGNFPLALFS